MARKLFGGVIGTIAVAGEAARHLAWYVSYHVGGTTHESQARRPRGR